MLINTYQYNGPALARTSGMSESEELTSAASGIQ